MSPLPSSQGMYFEEFQPGQQIVTAGRTIGESDVLAFAGLSGDFNPIHTDAEFSKSTPYGQRIVHGLLCLSIAVGLTMRSGFLGGTVLAFREIADWKFVKPVLLGDTIRAEVEVAETKALPRLHAGMVMLTVTVKNQHDETTMKGNWTALVASTP